MPSARKCRLGMTAMPCPVKIRHILAEGGVERASPEEARAMLALERRNDRGLV